MTVWSGGGGGGGGWSHMIFSVFAVSWGYDYEDQIMKTTKYGYSFIIMCLLVGINLRQF